MAFPFIAFSCEDRATENIDNFVMDDRLVEVGASLGYLSYELSVGRLEVAEVGGDE